MDQSGQVSRAPPCRAACSMVGGLMTSFPSGGGGGYGTVALVLVKSKMNSVHPTTKMSKLEADEENENFFDQKLIVGF